MAEREQVQGILKEHGDEHARDGNEGGVQERKKRAYQRLQHASLRSRWMEINGDSGHHMLAILMPQKGRDSWNEGRQRS